jgi:glycosyltransferase involved in cell wall biosynthesis
MAVVHRVAFSKMKLKIAIVKSVIPGYRQGFYDGIFADEDFRVTVFCQERIPGFNLKYIHARYPDNVHLVKYWTANREKISWQFIPWIRIFRDFDVVFVEGNPRNITHLLLSTLLRITGKKVVLWTMAHSFDANPVTENIRLFWSRMFKFLFVYNDAEVTFLRNKGFRKQVIVGMNNGLNQRKIEAAIAQWPPEVLQQWVTSQCLNGRRILLSCSRLDPKNKYYQLVEALPAIVEQYPDILWCIIGKGMDEANIRELVDKKGLSGHTLFVGELYDEEKLAPWFLSAEMLVHPAGIGLTILHAFGYGLPVITHGRAEFHGPEYAAFAEGATGYNFEQNDVADLSSKVVKLLGEDAKRNEMKNTTLELARNVYNVDIMVKRFAEISKMAAAG